MQRLNPRRLSRRLSASLTFLLLFAIFGAVVSEFFVEFGKEQGWYDKPSARLEAVMIAFSSFVTQTWFLIAAAFLAGLTTGWWVDVFLRRWEAALAQRPQQNLTPLGKPGQLDYLVEGLQSLQDITAIFQSAAKDTNRIVRAMSRYKMLLQLVNNPSRKRKLASRFAGKLNAFSEKLREYGPRIADAARRTHVNCLAVIEGTPILNHDDLASLMFFVNTLQKMGESAARSATAVSDARAAALFIIGISRELNAAADLYSAATENLGAEILSYGEICNQLLVDAMAKVTEAEATLASRAGLSLAPIES